MVKCTPKPLILSIFPRFIFRVNDMTSSQILERARTPSHHWNCIHFRQKTQRRERGETDK
jgi:hypothetical protein